MMRSYLEDARAARQARQEEIDIERRAVLDGDHFGLGTDRRRIIACTKLNPRPLFHPRSCRPPGGCAPCSDKSPRAHRTEVRDGGVHDEQDMDIGDLRGRCPATSSRRWQGHPHPPTMFDADKVSVSYQAILVGLLEVLDPSRTTPWPTGLAYRSTSARYRSSAPTPIRCSPLRDYAEVIQLARWYAGGSRRAPSP